MLVNELRDNILFPGQDTNKSKPPLKKHPNQVPDVTMNQEGERGHEGQHTRDGKNAKPWKKPRKCSFCACHGLEEADGHNCPYRDCPCQLCCLSRSAAAIGRYQAKVWETDQHRRHHWKGLNLHHNSCQNQFIKNFALHKTFKVLQLWMINTDQYKFPSRSRQRKLLF